MKPHTIPMIMLTTVIMLLTAGLIYYVVLVTTEVGVVKPKEGAVTETPTAGEEFSCKKDIYSKTDVCLFPDLQITTVELPDSFKVGLAHDIEVQVYNAGKDTNSGYEVTQFYFDPLTKQRLEIGSSSVSGVHNSGQTKTVDLTWVPKVLGRYRYRVELTRLEETGMPQVMLEKKLTEWADFVTVEESKTACQVQLLTKDVLSVIYDKDKCNILEDSKVVGSTGNQLVLNSIDEKITVIEDVSVSFSHYQTAESRSVAYFIVDGKELKTSPGGIIGTDTVFLGYENLKCEVQLTNTASVTIKEGVKCNIVNDQDIIGRTDIWQEGWYNTYAEPYVTRETKLTKGQYTIINQDVVKYVDVEKNSAFKTFKPIIEINGVEVPSNEASTASYSVFGE